MNGLSDNSSSPFPADLVHSMQARMALYQQIRHFFSARQVSEVETPILSPYGSTDVHIDSFVTHHDEQLRYLHTSPEFYMKRLLAAGFADCFQIAKVFRHEAACVRHRPEFSMLEWYRLGFSMQALIDEVAILVKTLCPQWQALPVEIISYAQAFALLGIDPHTDDLPTLKQKISQKIGYKPTLDDKRDEWLDFALVTLIEKQLGRKKLTFLTHYPASMAALAKTTLDSNGNVVAERFELYYQGIELANGFHELTDADEQQARFIADNRTRQANGQPTVTYDKHLISALSSGFPDCSGVALGLDRLLMLKLDKACLDDIMLS